MKKNKNGFLLAEETLKIVIAVIAIGFLVYFLTSLYFKNKDSKDLELAKASLNQLVEEINSGQTDVEVYNPTGWVIVSWQHKVLKGTYGFRKEVEDIPNFCKNLGWVNCLCICKDTTILNLEGSDCDSNGFCVQSDFKIKDNVIKIENPPVKLKIDYSDKITITQNGP